MTKNIKILFIPLLLLVFSACENNMEVIKNLTNAKDIPRVKAQNMEIIYSDSGKVKLKVEAKEVDKYDTPDKQYTEFPQGITVFEYDTAMNVISTIQANYALFHENEKLWEARSNVVAKNFKKNEQLYTEELFWDQAKGRIYSTKFSKIISDDRITNGEGGFTARQDLSDIHMFDINGVFNINENDSIQGNP
jgi:LPS export ABC transporter protein LptC